MARSGTRKDGTAFASEGPGQGPGRGPGNGRPKQNWPAAPKGHERALDFGQRRRRTEPPGMEEARADIAAGMPVRDQNGDVPVYDETILEAAARLTALIRDVTERMEGRGSPRLSRGPRPVLVWLGDALMRQANLLDKLGMTPTSRAKLGLDLQKTVDLATAMSAATEERERREQGRDDDAA